MLGDSTVTDLSSFTGTGSCRVLSSENLSSTSLLIITLVISYLR